MSDFSKVELKKFDEQRTGPYVKFRRERVGAPDAEFWLAVGDELKISTGNPEMPMLAFTILEVKL